MNRGRFVLRACLPAAALCLLMAPVCADNAKAGEGRILSSEMSVDTRDSEPVLGRQKPRENLLDSMDVYALSPSARFLAMPRPMITHELACAMKTRQIVIPQGEWKRIIAKAAATYGLPSELIASMIKTESSFQANACSPKGAQGAMQIMPSTQKELGLVDPWDPEQNVMAGCAYLKKQLAKFGSLSLALAAYNAGPASVEKYGGIPPYAETQHYVQKILSGVPAKMQVR